MWVKLVQNMGLNRQNGARTWRNLVMIERNNETNKKMKIRQ